MSISKSEFGFFRGYKCWLVTLTNSRGAVARLTNFGGAVVGLEVPDRNGVNADVVLGYDTLQEYVDGNSSHGALVGRYANRIGGAKINVSGREYRLSANDNNVNHLHGGFFGYNKRVWTVDAMDGGDEPSVTFGYVSPDGEENYPGTLKISVKYTLTNSNALVIDYTAVSDADTVINLTNHSYFNLTNGYDHNFILGDPGVMRTAAEVCEPETGRVMTVKTDKPAIQFYIGIGLDGENGKNGKKYNKYAGLCLESQFSPDTPNKPQFPTCVYKAGQTYRFTTVYEFSVR